MHIQYTSLIDVQGSLNRVEVDFDSNVLLTVEVKGRTAKITMSVDEAAKLYAEMKKNDIEGLAKVYGATT